MTVSISTMPPQIQQRYNGKLLSTPERNLIHNLFAVPVELPDNNGFIDRQSRYDIYIAYQLVDNLPVI